MSSTSSLLFTPLQVGAWRLRQRVVMAPLTRCRAGEGRVPTPLMVEYYRQRAGAGMILSEATAVDPMGVGYPDTPGLWSEEHVRGWQPVTRAVREAGGLLVAQLWHVGRVSHPVYLHGADPVAPSALAAPGHVSLLRPKQPYPVPRALAREELPGIVAAYRAGARNAQRAGFDGVELHAANGYLIDQFLQTASNQRTDDYGGAIPNRARLLLEVVDALVAEWGAERVGVHLNPRGSSHGMGDTDPAALFGYVATELARRRIAFLCVREPMDERRRYLPGIKRAFGGVVIANEEFTLAQADAVLRAGEADAVAWGRLYIANPDLAERLQRGAPLNEPDPNTFFWADHALPIAQGYTDYPALG